MVGCMHACMYMAREDVWTYKATFGGKMLCCVVLCCVVFKCVCGQFGGGEWGGELFLGFGEGFLVLWFVLAVASLLLFFFPSGARACC